MDGHILHFDATWVGSVSVVCSCSSEPILVLTGNKVLAEHVLLGMQHHLDKEMTKDKIREAFDW